MQSQHISRDLFGLGPVYRAQLDQSEHLGQWKKDREIWRGWSGPYPDYLLNYTTRQSGLFQQHIHIKSKFVKGGQKGPYHYMKCSPQK